MRETALCLGIIASVLVAGCATGPPATQPAPTRAGAPYPRVMGYHVYWTGEAWREYDTETLHTLFFFEISIDSSGGFQERHGWPDRWLPMQQDVQAHDVRVAPVVSLSDPASFVALFSSSSARDTLMASVLGLFHDNPQMDGIQLDVEIFTRVPAEARDGYTQFVRDLKQRLADEFPGKELSLFLLADDPGDTADEAAVAEHADFVVVQGYDLHARNDEQAGPVAALDGWGRRNWRFIVDRFMDLGVPASKIVMAVPYFGYEWPTETDRTPSRTRGPGVTSTLAPVDSTYLPEVGRPVASLQAALHGMRRDPESGSPYYVYQDTTGWYQGWYEDAESLRAKYEFVVREGLGGVAIFPLAFGDSLTAVTMREVFGRATIP